MSEKNMTPRELMEAIVKTADARKADDIVAMQVTERTTLADYFIIMTGTSSTHIRSLSNDIEKKLKDDYELAPNHTEGVTSNWVLMDYGTVVVNIFLKEARELYALERLWSDAIQCDIDKLITK